MGASHYAQAIRQYQHSQVNAATAGATPHQLVAMLLEGALDRTARARGAVRNGDLQGRIRNITAAISIVEYLNLCLDQNAGPMSTRLAELYDFCLRHLARANAAGDAVMLDQVADVLRPIKQAWEEMMVRREAA